MTGFLVLRFRVEGSSSSVLNVTNGGSESKGFVAFFLENKCFFYIGVIGLGVDSPTPQLQSVYSAIGPTVVVLP